MRALAVSMVVALLGLWGAAELGAQSEEASEYSEPELEAPWRRRRRRDLRPSRRSRLLVAPSDWPEEPASPSGDIDAERFARALRQLCGWMPPGRAERYGGWILQYAAQFEVDPFLLGGLVHRMSRCNPRAEELDGVGLTLIPSRMHWDVLRRGTYRYQVHEGGDWAERTLGLDAFPFNDVRLARPEENLYFAAGLMRVWREQASSIKRSFPQYAHRHYISHWTWGDRVKSDRAEDRILLDRRRLLQYYGAYEVPDPIEREGMAWSPPLDGAPRVVSSWIGAQRDGGARNHRGIDVESVLGEPVRAIADGRVNFSGVDLPGSRNNRNMTPREIEQVPRHTLGRGGRYVCVLHHPEAGEWLRSCYMHLEDVEVRWGQEVRAGELLGTVGRTGMLRSAPHLHLELHSPDGLMDPSEVLAGHLIGTNPGF